ncbi:uncharacterized protein LOC126367237 [Pectinophora gossypiella]|uniref:uncharacterized protein LOC126367237 n=1 Tax=Pectinophora gossypiella TaxID=13191 RepID=UPI00214EFCA0|nr:uncharacterized protein LOC126367237 [Pectinophora gossypiella]
MENKPESANEKKTINKAKSYNNGQSGPPLKSKCEPSKRKSFNVNDAVMSLDLALGRLKKSKLVNGDSSTGRAAGAAPAGAAPSLRRVTAPSDMFMDISSPSSNINPGLTNASLMSMNFSHYELMRNLSRSNSNSEGAFSGTTCNTYCADNTLRDEHLEKYFRSVEMWNRKYRDGGGGAGSGPSVHFEIPEK